MSLLLERRPSVLPSRSGKEVKNRVIPYQVEVIETTREAVDRIASDLRGARTADLMFMFTQRRDSNDDSLDERLVAPIDKLLEPLSSVTGRKRFGIGNYDYKTPAGHPPLFPFLRSFIPSAREASVQIERADKLRSGLRERGVDVIAIQAQGVSDKVIGFANQVHSKVVQITREDGSVITYLPEFNLNLGSFYSMNSAIRFEEASEQAKEPHSIARTVTEYIEKVYRHEQFKDYAITIDDQTRLLVDAGRPGRSLIVGEATRMLKQDNIDDIFFASQYIPAGSAVKAMRRKAEQGTQVTILLSEDCKKNGQQHDLANFYRRIRNQENITVVYYPGPGRVHSKRLLVNSGIRIIESEGVKQVVIKPTGKEARALYGSNNLHPALYGVGTGEIAISTTNETIVGGLREGAVNALVSALTS